MLKVEGARGSCSSWTAGGSSSGSERPSRQTAMKKRIARRLMIMVEGLKYGWRVPIARDNSQQRTSLPINDES